MSSFNQFANLFPNAPPLYNERNLMNRGPNGKIPIRKNNTRRNNTYFVRNAKGVLSNKNRNNRYKYSHKNQIKVIEPENNTNIPTLIPKKKFLVDFSPNVQVREIEKIGQHKTPSGLPTSTKMRLNERTNKKQVLDMLWNRLQFSGVPANKLPYETLLAIDTLPLSDKKKQEVRTYLIEFLPELRNSFWGSKYPKFTTKVDATTE